jgi:L-threonylcarbamoyladenylate synthase
MSALILPTHTPALFAAAVARATALLRAGEVVALPTETVYGLAANALNAAAVARIYEIKGRPAYNPVIVHVADLELAQRCVIGWPETARRLAQSFWPGPLTMVLPRAAHIPDVVSAGGDTVGIRWPSHPFMQAVIRACNFPLAAPSANLANRISPTTAAHVREQLGDRLSLIVDGGPSQVGIESAVVDLVSQPPRILRPGMIHEESLVAALGELPPGLEVGVAGDGPHRSPGLLRKHYAPRARLLVAAWSDAADLAAQLAARNLVLSQAHIIAHTHIPPPTSYGGVSVIPHDAEAFARALYAELHRCDAAGAQWIVVEAPPDNIEWRGIRDRLSRAAAD